MPLSWLFWWWAEFVCTEVSGRIPRCTSWRQEWAWCVCQRGGTGLGAPHGDGLECPDFVALVVFCCLSFLLAVPVSRHGGCSPSSALALGCSCAMDCPLLASSRWCPICPVGHQLSCSRLTDTWPRAGCLHCRKVLKWC